MKFPWTLKIELLAEQGAALMQELTEANASLAIEHEKRISAEAVLAANRKTLESMEMRAVTAESERKQLMDIILQRLTPQPEVKHDPKDYTQHLEKRQKPIDPWKDPRAIDGLIAQRKREWGPKETPNSEQVEVAI